ncbi:MAG: hypothetical protein N2747_00425 [Chitinophagaceae bacterium]|nr:hypothetical protein [Chitinophagaceae bacterium]
MKIINWDIQIGEFKLQLLESLDITHSVEELTDTAGIKLPASTLNKAEQVEEKIKRGDPVIIQLGYDGQLRDEFSGYVTAINVLNDGIKILCEDNIYLYRKPIPNKQFGRVRLKEILNYITQHCGLTHIVQCDFEYTYEKFTIYEANGYDVLKKIQEDTKANVYVKNNELHCHMAYSETFGYALYDMSVNVEKSDLEYKMAEDKKVQVEVTCTNQKGEILKATVGSADGEKISIIAPGNNNKQGLTFIALQELENIKQSGYVGSLTAWLEPYVQSGYVVEIKDKDYPARTGKYYVKKVETSVSASGATRKIEIGKKMSL